MYQIQPGRVLNEDDGVPVKDSITTGLQSLTAGTKNPLSEYNEAFRLLQRRRKIIPVSAQAKSKSSPSSHARNDSEATRKVETLTDTGISLSTIPSLEIVQEHTSHGGLGSQTRSDPFQVIDLFEEGDITQEDEVITELARIIEDLENGVVDPTLATLGEEDVLLDMDDTFVVYQDDYLTDSSEGSVEGDDGG